MDCCATGDQHRTSACHCFQNSEPPGLIFIGKNESIAGTIKIADLIVLYLAGKRDLACKPQPGYKLLERVEIFGKAAIRSGEQEPDLATTAGQAAHRFNGILQAAMRHENPQP